MKTIVTTFAAIFFAGFAFAQGDSSLAGVQQALKDQGFYYGEVTGKKDSDTSAAIRRYQIRNGLQITGDLNPETQKSLGLKPTAPKAGATPKTGATPAATLKAAPAPVRPPPMETDASDLRDSDELDEEPAPEQRTFRAPPPVDGYAPGPRGLRAETSGALDDTPFEVAPPDVQTRVIVGAQTLLARQGYYRSGIDGVYGPGMEFALRAYQTRSGFEPSGRLDMETLAALGLLPGQQLRGRGGPRRNFRRPSEFAPNGERIYVPR